MKSKLHHFWKLFKDARARTVEVFETEEGWKMSRSFMNVKIGVTVFKK